MAYKEKGEVYPLLTTDWLGNPTYRQKPVARHIRGDDDIAPVIEDDDEVFDIIDQKKKRNVNMVWIDVFLLALDFLQVRIWRWEWRGGGVVWGGLLIVNHLNLYIFIILKY